MKTKISVVTSLYNSAKYIDELYRRLTVSLSQITDDYEIILVNDGSPDNSLEVCLAIYLKGDSKLKIIDLSRNCGQHKALMTGLTHASGEIVFMMDSDLEEDPELIVQFWNEYCSSKDTVDVIYGVQSSRRGGFVERWSGKLFYKSLNALSQVKVNDNPTPFRLMTRRYVNALIQFQEREVFFLGISLLAGFNQKSMQIEKHSSSATGYRLLQKVDQFINAITSFSNMPLMFIFHAGAAVSSLSLVYILFILVQYFVHGVGVEGWTSLMASVWLVGGIIIFCLGIIGVYLSRIFVEVKNRPYTIIKNIYE